MLSRKPKKESVPLPERPLPPTVDQIIEDVGNTCDEDVVFSKVLVETERKSAPVLMSESFCSEDALDKTQSSTGDSSLTEADSAEQDADLVYQQAEQFINLTEKLENTPTTLKEQYQYLVKLGQDLEKSIEELKQQSSSVKESIEKHTARVK